ncbi:MAG TPA: ATP-binding protein [Herpetosiphonaceae bacterium]
MTRFLMHIPAKEPMEAERGRLLKVAALIIGLGAASYLPVSQLAVGNILGAVIGVLCLAVVVFGLAHVGYIQPGAMLLGAGLMAALYITSSPVDVSERMHAITYLMPIMVMGLVIGSRAVLAFGGLSLLMVGSILLTNRLALSTWSVNSIIILSIGTGLLWLIMRRLEQRNIALQTSLRHEQQLLQDMRERKRTEEEAIRAKALAEAANQAKSEFLSRMSHELRTPLNAILGYAQLLQMQPLTELQQKNVGSIRQGGQHLLRLINDVLDISRIEIGELAFSIEPVNLKQLHQELLDIIQPLAQGRRVTIIDESASFADVFVLADYHRLKQVLLNLLSNAIKYNREESGKVKLSASFEADDRVRVSVSDTGHGISQDKIDSLFTPFTRLEPERTAIEGIGLGLALSKQLVQTMGGSIGVESIRGVGSTFWIIVPRAEVSAAVEERGHGGV